MLRGWVRPGAIAAGSTEDVGVRRRRRQRCTVVNCLGYKTRGSRRFFMLKHTWAHVGC